MAAAGSLSTFDRGGGHRTHAQHVVLPMTWRRTETPTALADKVPTVAGALKSIDEVKKLARHPSSQAAHHNNFFDSLTGQLCMCVCAIVQSAREVIAAMPC